jgi:hypothetical protein
MMISAEILNSLILNSFRSGKPHPDWEIGGPHLQITMIISDGSRWRRAIISRVSFFSQHFSQSTQSTPASLSRPSQAKPSFSAAWFLSRNLSFDHVLVGHRKLEMLEANMGFGRGALLWLLGVPLPIIILLALFWHH